MPALNTQNDIQLSTRLGARAVYKYYGEVASNRGISFEARLGEIHAIVGENGAGKSTLMRILQGLEKPDQGSVVVDDNNVSFNRPQQALDLGIGMVHQEFMLAPELTLLENLVLGDEPVSRTWGPFSEIDWDEARRSGDALAKDTGVPIDWDSPSETASVHIQQLVEIIRLLRRGANILILDEPTAVLAPPQVEDLFALLHKLRDKGTTIIFISHKIKEVIALADRVTVLRRGEVTFTAEIKDVDVATIAHHIVGGNAEDTTSQSINLASKYTKLTKQNCLRLENVCAISSTAKSRALQNIGFSIRQGEIVGIAGVAGNGQDELIECLVGLRRVQSGRIILDDVDIPHKSNAERRASGIGFISPDRANEGLAKLASVEENVIAGSHRDPAALIGPLRKLSYTKQMATKRLDALGVIYGDLTDPVSSLSGGNQQRLVFAREISGVPKLLLVAQPTRGVDLNGITAIHKTLRAYRAGGGSVLLLSEELDELLALSDRILVIVDGRIVGERNGAKANITEIGALMVMQGEVHA